MGRGRLRWAGWLAFIRFFGRRGSARLACRGSSARGSRSAIAGTRGIVPEGRGREGAGLQRFSCYYNGVGVRRITTRTITHNRFEYSGKKEGFDSWIDECVIQLIILGYSDRSMGGEQSYGRNPLNHSKLLESQADHEIYQSDSGEEFEKYTIFHDGSQDFERNYHFRVENKHNDLVDVLFAGPTQGIIGCTDRGRYQVITERITRRLGSMKGLDAKNALLILKTALRGFRDLYRKHGIFGIKESMIGVNGKGKAKVWINHNFAVNRPQETPSSYVELSDRDKERQMVQSVIDLIDLRSDHCPLWREMIHLREMQDPCTFDEALNLVDYFCGGKQLKLADHVRIGGSKTEKRIEMVLQSNPAIENHTIEVKKDNRVNGQYHPQYVSANLPTYREPFNSKMQHQNQRPIIASNTQTIIPATHFQPPNMRFTFNLSESKEGPIVSSVASQQPIPLPQQITYLPVESSQEKKVKLLEEAKSYKIQTHVPALSQIAVPQAKAENVPIDGQKLNINQQNFLKQPPIEVHIHQITSEKSLSDNSASAINSRHELNNSEISYPEYKIVLCLQSHMLDNRSEESKQIEPQKAAILSKAKENASPFEQNKDFHKKEQRFLACQGSITYKQMRRLLLLQLQE